MKKKRNLFVALIAVAAIVAAGAMTLGKSSKKWIVKTTPCRQPRLPMLS